MSFTRDHHVEGALCLGRTKQFNWLALPFVAAVAAILPGCLERPIAEAKPVTTNIVIQKQANKAITGIDLLLMIDNSSSMADKQDTLASAVPQLLGQLVAPNCVDGAGNLVVPHEVAKLGVGEPCSQGSPEFNPVNNIHIGIVSSSLGDHGAGNAPGVTGVCTVGLDTHYTNTDGTEILTPPDLNDKGHLIGTLDRAALARSVAQNDFVKLDPSLGFLAWGNSNLPSPGPTDLDTASLIFQDMVKAVDEKGCGLEAQLESWFRFLIDPVPPTLPIGAPDDLGNTHRIGSDDTLLNQRKAFLRPDSLVAIVMLTDENDCSIRDTDVGWVGANIEASIQTGSTPCASNPNDPNCFSCSICGHPNSPAKCATYCPNLAGKPETWDDGPYQTNIRCWQQKRRFGYEFMYPTSRYVVGLTKKVLCPDQSFGDMDCDCTYAKSIGAGCDPGSRQMPNPLFSTVIGTDNNNQPVVGFPDSIARTDNSAVFIAGIVGVPWQDIGNTDANGNLTYIPVTDPAWTGGASSNQPVNAGSAGIWAQIYGDDNANIAAKDMHMVESVVPRAGIPGPTAGPTPPTNTDPNGADYNTARGDLEYACIYTLPTAHECGCLDPNTQPSCLYLTPNDCCKQNYESDLIGTPDSGADYDKPLCNGTTQVAAKGYPGLREIAVLRDYALSSAAESKGNSIVASICPRDLTVGQEKSPGYGYNPAVAALISRLKEKLRGSCLPRQLTVISDDPNSPDYNKLPCNVVEAVSKSSMPSGTDCTSFCTNNHRNIDGPPSPQMTQAVVGSMQESNICDSPHQPACSTMCLCLLPQETGDNLSVCENATDGTQDESIPPGYCYVDPFGTPAIGNPDIVAQCRDTEKRVLRFVGNSPTGKNQTAVPLAGAYVFTACQGSALGASSVTASPADAGQ